MVRITAICYTFVMPFISLIWSVLLPSLSFAGPFDEVLGIRLTPFAHQSRIVGSFEALAGVVVTITTPDEAAALRASAARRGNGNDVLGFVFDYIADTAAQDRVAKVLGLTHPVLGARIGTRGPGAALGAMLPRLIKRGLAIDEVDAVSVSGRILNDAGVEQMAARIDRHDGPIDPSQVMIWIFEVDQSCERKLDETSASIAIRALNQVRATDARLHEISRKMHQDLAGGVANIERVLRGELPPEATRASGDHGRRRVELMQVRTEITRLETIRTQEKVQRALDEVKLDLARTKPAFANRLPSPFRPELAEVRQAREADLARLPELYARRDALAKELKDEEHAD